MMHSIWNNPEKYSSYFMPGIGMCQEIPPTWMKTDTSGSREGSTMSS